MSVTFQKGGSLEIKMPSNTQYIHNICFNRVRTHPGKYCNLIVRITGLDYTGNSSKVLENLEYEPIFGALFTIHVYIYDAP